MKLSDLRPKMRIKGPSGAVYRVVRIEGPSDRSQGWALLKTDYPTERRVDLGGFDSIQADETALERFEPFTKGNDDE